MTLVFGLSLLLVTTTVLVQVRSRNLPSTLKVELEPTRFSVLECRAMVRPVAEPRAVAPSRAPPTFLRRSAIVPGIRAAE
jgi:hypothetical protein